MKARTANKVLPKAGVTNFYDTFVLKRTLVFQANGSAETPRLRQYLNRYKPPMRFQHFLLIILSIPLFMACDQDNDLGSEEQVRVVHGSSIVEEDEPGPPTDFIQPFESMEACL